ncbi:unnamed protein product [Pieris brassicae]|uniref:Reverse transcriptase domain-containing protein n=1 Tax=Pieris brassicae TaxID=7116 RepID=A0A9P0TAX5_PIEBR|nr:unnamed protein product [Pieris brassicae]
MEVEEELACLWLIQKLKKIKEACEAELNLDDGDGDPGVITVEVDPDHFPLEVECNLQSVRPMTIPPNIGNVNKIILWIQSFGRLSGGAGVVVPSLPSQVPPRITAKEIAEIIKNMTKGKSPGHDHLSIEHLQHASPHLPRLLALLYTFYIRHSYLPGALMRTLRQTGVPGTYVDLFSHWYEHQTNQIRWSNTLSKEYRLECGVRQGGLTSTALFNLYINELIEALGGTRVGCSIDGHCVNSNSYADDMVLLSPSVGALRSLLSICERYAESHGLLYNVKESELLVFKAAKKKPTYVSPVTLGGVPLKRINNVQKYVKHHQRT